MNRKSLVSIVTAGLIIVGTQSVFASDFIQKQFNCPKSGAQLVGTPDGNINVEDIIISIDANTDVVIKFVGEGLTRNLMRVFMKANTTIVSNFGDGVNGERDHALKLSCGGVATVFVTIVGSGDIE